LDSLPWIALAVFFAIFRDYINGCCGSTAGEKQVGRAGGGWFLLVLLFRISTRYAKGKKDRDRQRLQPAPCDVRRKSTGFAYPLGSELDFLLWLRGGRTSFEVIGRPGNRRLAPTDLFALAAEMFGGRGRRSSFWRCVFRLGEIIAGGAGENRRGG